MPAPVAGAAPRALGPGAAAVAAGLATALCLLWLLRHAGSDFLLGLAPTLLLCLAVLAVKSFEIQLPALLAFTYLPGHQLLAVVPWLLLAKEVFIRGWFKVGPLEILLGLWMLVSLAFNEGNLAHFAHYFFATWYWWAMLKWLGYHDLSPRFLSGCLTLLIAMQVLQFLFMVPQIAMVWPGTHGDEAKGTMMSNNFYLGGKSIFLLLLAYYLWQYSRAKVYLALFGMFALSWIMTGLKTSVIAVFAVLCLKLFNSRLPLILKIMAPAVLAVALFGLVFLVDSDFQNILAINRWIWSIGKLKVFADTAQYFTENPIHFLMGLGPGQFLSRAALISTGGLETQYSGLIPIAGNALTDQLIYTTYTPELIEWSNGAVLFSPNSSIIAVLTELGIPGLCLWAFAIYSGLARIRKAVASGDDGRAPLAKALLFFAGAMTLLGMLDYWLEYPSVMIPVLLVYEYLRRNPSSRVAPGRGTAQPI